MRPVLAAALTGVGYYFGAKVGLALTFQPHPVSTLWPPNSILLAALLLVPIRWWWCVILAALPAHLLVELRSGVPAPMVLSWFISNSTEALIGAAFIRYLNKRQLLFDDIRQVAIFLIAALLAPFFSSFLDAGFVILNRFGSAGYWQIWRMRFLANVLAELTIVPVIVLWGKGQVFLRPKLSHWRWLETFALALALLAVGFVAFGWFRGDADIPALLYAPLPVLLWAAVRFGPKAVNTSLAVVAFLAIWNAVHGLGPFSGESSARNALEIQLFLILISMPLMFLAAVIQERGRSVEEMRQSQDRLKMALNAAQMGTWDWNLVDGTTRWSSETKRMFGLLPTDREGPPDFFFGLLHPDDRERVKQTIERSVAECLPYESEFRIPRADGSVRWIRGRGKVIVDDNHLPLRLIGINADITTRKAAENQLIQSNRQVRLLAGRLISAQEAERRRVSYELHDDLSQKVATLALAISRVKRKLPSEQTDVIDQLNELHDRTDDLSDHIRQLSHELHPAILDHLGLAEALTGYVRDYQSEQRIRIKFNSDLRSEVPFDVSICLYRICLEALRNIAKHSSAKSASVLLAEDEKFVTLEVADSGTGFDIETARRGSGLGLMSAEERVRLLQGTFELISNPGQGTRVIARIPLNKHESS